MTVSAVADRFEDERGIIQDLLGPVDSVTEIFTHKGFVRGNHVHHKTTQWVYMIKGKMRVSHGGKEQEFQAGDRFIEGPGVPHAWRALEDTLVLVFTKGPRSGENFESDTVRLEPEDHLLVPLCAACHQPGSAEAPLRVLTSSGPMHQRCPSNPVIAEGHWYSVAEYQ